MMALFAVNPDLYQPHPKLKGGLVAFLGLLSIVGTYPGALNPWVPAYPLVRFANSIPESRRFIPLVLSGYNAYEDIDPGIREGFGLNTVLRRWVDSRSGFVIPEGGAWWFIDESTFVYPMIAGALGLDLSGGVALKTNLSSRSRNWLESFDTETYQSALLFPTTENEITPFTLPITYSDDGDSMSLISYQIVESEQGVTLVTGWRVEERRFPIGSRRIFVHLLDQDGNIVEQSDMFSARYNTLIPGDLFFQVQKLSFDQLPAGHYWMQMGLYNPDIGSRLMAGESDRLLLKIIEIPE
jgi:hypothetical protein